MHGSEKRGGFFLLAPRPQFPLPFVLHRVLWTLFFGSVKLKSVIITGESGAGKSEACKLVLQFIADLSAAHSGRTVTEDEQSLEQQLLQVRYVCYFFHS